MAEVTGVTGATRVTAGSVAGADSGTGGPEIGTGGPEIGTTGPYIGTTGTELGTNGAADATAVARWTLATALPVPGLAAGAIKAHGRGQGCRPPRRPSRFHSDVPIAAPEPYDPLSCPN